jgi:hypothetical protein
LHVNYASRSDVLTSLPIFHSTSLLSISRRSSRHISSRILRTSLARQVNRQLRSPIMATRTHSTSRQRPSTERHRCNARYTHRLGLEIRPIKSHDSLHTYEISAEPSGERALDQENRSAVESRRCELSVSGCVDTGCIDNFACDLLVNLRLQEVGDKPLFLNVRHSFPAIPPTSKRTWVVAPLVTAPDVAVSVVATVEGDAVGREDAVEAV